MIDITGTRVEIKIDPSRYRPVDVSYIEGDNAKIKEGIGWIPQIPIETTLRDLLVSWEERM